MLTQAIPKFRRAILSKLNWSNFFLLKHLEIKWGPPPQIASLVIGRCIFPPIHQSLFSLVGESKILVTLIPYRNLPSPFKRGSCLLGAVPSQSHYRHVSVLKLSFGSLGTHNRFPRNCYIALITEVKKKNKKNLKVS